MRELEPSGLPSAPGDAVGRGRAGIAELGAPPGRGARIDPRVAPRVPRTRGGSAELPPPVRAAVLLAIAAAVLAGLVARIWYLGHEPLSADEAVVGLMARHILAGHANAFYWGQRYGGVEPYVVAAVFWLAGPSVAALRATPIALEAAACVLVWLAGRHLVRRKELALLAAAAMWAAPQSAVWNSTIEYGFRGVTMACGVALILFTRRVVERDRPGWDLVALGAAAGVGWWASPEIVYFAVPCGLWLLRWIWARRADLRADLRRHLAWWSAAVVVGAAGALPWLWDNVTSGFPSLNASTYYVPSTTPGFAARVAIFVKDSLPLLLDLRVPASGVWSVTRSVGLVLTGVLGAALAAAGLWCVARRTVGAALAVAVGIFPFLFAMNPGSWLWQSGRYVSYFVPLALLLAISALDDAATSVGARSAARVASHARSPAPRRAARGLVAVAVAVAALFGSVASSALDLARYEPVLVPPGTALGPGGPDAPAAALAASLERHGVREGFADYWVAYKLDFLSGGRLRIMPTPPSPLRSPGVMASVRGASARDQAWLFVTPTPAEELEYHVFGSTVIQGPSGMPEATFLADLARLGDRSRVVRLGPVTAVYSSRRVSFAELGLHPHPG